VSCDKRLHGGTYQGSHVWQSLFAHSHAVWLPWEFVEPC
jgi:hypothetical protein